VVLLGIGINLFAQNNALVGEHLVKIPQASSANEFLSFFTHPDFSMFLNKDVWITGVTLALVASLESLLSI
jgi:MFS superfamily sulfate permease-like transporter